MTATRARPATPTDSGPVARAGVPAAAARAGSAAGVPHIIIGWTASLVEGRLIGPVYRGHMSDLHRADVDLLTTQNLGVLITIKRDGRPQSSNINYAYDADEQCARISVTADRAKTKNMLRDPRANLHVMSADGWSWTVAEGIADLTPVAATTDDATVDELVALYRTVAGEHPDWDEYRRAMVNDRRLVVRLNVERTYGSAQR
jgi:PPOX class probable F420-dependent enzyme